jgi:uncharacterized protein with PIN domain
LPALFVPLRLSPLDQLAHVLGQLGLPLRDSLCMSCGGPLVDVPKDAVRGRVPARTFAWLERFWECSRCGRVFWQGTHWPRIVDKLRQAVAKSE